ncbi:hypothetical protein ACHAPI_012024, partial [Fusarium lateritium]
MQHSSVSQVGTTPSPHGSVQTSGSPSLGHPQEEPCASREAASPADYGAMQSTGGGANYVGSAHWAAVLDSIAELKDHFDNEEPSYPEEQVDDDLATDMAGPHLLLGCPKPTTKEEILASLPNRQVVDRLVSRYFNSFEISAAVLHTAEFLNEYEVFWEDPAAASLTWLGLLFTIMCLAIQFEKALLGPCTTGPATTFTEQDLQKKADMFRLRVSQCLILGDYIKGGPYVLETLMLYIASEVFRRNDAEIDVWILMGTTVQIAMQMGYHRDPKHFEGMSPFTAEMRRRVWATIFEMDLGISAQMGLPRLIKQWQTDTQAPSNLQDSDFNKSTVEMPPSRPQTDFTPMLYRLVKAKLTNVVGNIWDFLADVRPYPYTEVQKMDSKLDEARNSIPEGLRWHSIARCITDSPRHIIGKVVLETLFHRAKIVLHRKYVFGPPAESANSKRIVLQSALKLLDYQHMLQEETQPFCQLYHERWRVSSLVNHDFLLATSILCYYLRHIRAEPRLCDESLVTNEAILGYLRRSYDIWLLSSNHSKEARKVVKALKVVLDIGNDHTPGTTDSGVHSDIAFDDPSAFMSSSISEFHQGIPGGFGVQFPALNDPLISNWAILGDDLLTIPTTTPDSEWQAMDETVDVMG